MKKPVVNITMNKTVLKKLDAWIAKQGMRPTRSAAIESVIRDFLEAQNDAA